MASLTKLLAICAGTAGGAAACVGAGVVPTPLNLTPDPPTPPRTVRVAPVSAEGTAATNPIPVPAGVEETPDEAGGDKPSTTVEAAPDPVENGAVEYTPPPATTAPPEPAGAASSSSGSAAGEFGP